MEHAPYSPIASTSRHPYVPNSPFVPTSDFGEREEEDAFSGGEEYWKKQARVDGHEAASRHADRVPESASSDDELAMSPTRPLPSRRVLGTSTSTTKRTRTPSPDSPDPATSSSRTSPIVARTSIGTSPVLLRNSSPSPKRKRSVSPVGSDDSLDTLDPIAQHKPPRKPTTPPLSSPDRHDATLPRRSTSPPEQIEELIPSPAKGRSLRTRTAQQLHPFSIEQLRYRKTLLKNGWAGAVVAGQKAVELSAEELRQRKLAQERKKKDDLGGWLVDAEEPGSGGKRPEEIQSGDGQSTSDREESEDGMTLLEREARKAERMRREIEAGFGIERKRTAGRTDGSPRRRNGPSRIDDPGRSTSTLHRKQSSKSRANRPRAESEPPTSSPGHGAHQDRHGKKTGKSSKVRQKPFQAHDGQDRARKQRKATSTRADSEPPASSPARLHVHVSTATKRRIAKPSKSVHAHGRDRDRTALDADILNVPRIESDLDSDSDDVQVESLDGESEIPSDSEAEEEDEEGSEAEEGEDDATARRSRYKLDTSRKRALTSMLPKSFFKKAQEDLKLMERERAMGIDSGDELNSGDEEAQEIRKNKAKRRKDARRLDEPMRFDGDAFTDESGEEPDRTDSEAEQEAQEEHDAVYAWERNFAPARGRAGRGDDIVERFLKQARRPKKSVKQGGKKQEAKGSRVIRDANGSREGGKDRPRRSGGGDERPKVSEARSRPLIKAVRLDSERALFASAGLRHEGDDDAAPIRFDHDRQPSVTSAAVPDMAQSARSERDDEIWASFANFTFDFGIERLPPGVQFASSESFIQNGHLYSLIQPSTASLASTFAYGLALNASATIDEIAGQLPTLMDAIHDSITSQSSPSAEAGVEPVTDLSRALRFLGNFISTKLASTTPDDKYRFGSTLATHLDHLDLRLANNEADIMNSKSSRTARILQSWYTVDLTARLASTFAIGGDSRRLGRFVSHLVRLLLADGLDNSISSLKRVMQVFPTGQLTVSDTTVEAWTGLISLATRTECQGDATFDEGDLWNIVVEETLASLATSVRSRGGPVAGELLSLTAMFLCAASQFSPSGISSSKPRLRTHWPVMLQCLDSIQAGALTGTDHVASSTAISRRDRYLWTLFARCLVFVERWDWKMQVNDEVLARLFGLAAARRLANLSIEHRVDFPTGLEHPEKFNVIELEPNKDTAFSIFLKLVISAANNLPESTDAEQRKRSTQLVRLAVRLAPISTDWNDQSPELAKSDSILVNHYSLLLTLAILHPAQAGQRVEQARKLAAFAKADKEVRKATVRAIWIWARAFRHFDLPLEPLLAWLGSIVSLLTTEYLDVEKQPRIEHSGKSKGDLLWPRAVLISMSLRLVQRVMRLNGGRSTERDLFPEPSLLRPTWTSEILKSALALDPMIGREVLETIACYLELRSSALQAIQARSVPDKEVPPIPQQDSQDDYGMDEFDFNDPALDALLGEGEDHDAAVALDGEAEAIQSKDKLLVQTIKADLGPAFFSLVTRIYSNSMGSGPQIGDRAGYASEVIKMWTDCVEILVSHRVDEWRSYLRYGNHSFQRIGDALGKLDTGLFLAIQILGRDRSILTDCSEEILSIWFSTIGSATLTSQHILTSALLNAESPSPLFENAPYTGAATPRPIEIEQLDLLDHRIELLKVVFANAARIASFQPSAAAPFAKPLLPKPTVMRYLRDMLSSMRAYLSAIRDKERKRSYATLVDAILQSLANARAPDSDKSLFTESTLPDIKVLRDAISFYL
ncbi:hypothetical protein JCM3766R1_005759 [Sporobolomyces carnicolor]